MKKPLFSVVIALITMCMHAQHNYDNQNTIYSLSGNVGVGVTNPATKLHIDGDVRGNRAGGALRINGTFGYIDVGPLNSGWAHIYSDMPNFIFNKDVYTTTNAFSSYNNDLLLKTEGVERLRIKDENGFTGIGIANPQTKLHINGDIRGNRAGGALRINGTFGYIDVGPLNTGWAHIYTDMPNFIFNKDVYTTTNAFSSYNNDLILKTEGVERLRIKDENGFVGIGTSNIQSKLHLNALDRNAFRIYREGRIDKYLSIWHGTGGAVIEPIRTDNTTGVLYLGGYDTPTDTYFARSGGDVGIGTTNTRGYKLAVNGKIRAKEIVVEASPWPDYVFKKEYNLPTLSEVAEHIKTKGHLPNIPSEKEITNNGVSLGEINAKLLQKIEELTLYTIQQEEKLLTLQKKNEKFDALAQRIATLEKLLKTNN